MTKIDANDDLAEFRSAFFEECTEMLCTIDNRLGGLQDTPLEQAGLNEIFRAVHTIKGSAGFFNLEAVVEFAHTFETLLSALRDSRISQNQQSAALLVEGADALAAIVDFYRESDHPPAGFASEIVKRMEDMLCGSAVAEPAEAGAGPVAGAPTVNSQGPTRKLEVRFSLTSPTATDEPQYGNIVRQLDQLGTLQIIKNAHEASSNAGHAFIGRLETTEPDEAIRGLFDFVEHELELKVCGEELSAPEGTVVEARSNLRRDSSADAASDGGTPEVDASGTSETSRNNSRSNAATIRVELSRVDRLVNMVGELVITQAMLAQQIADQNTSNRPQLRQGHEDLANYTRELQECVMAIRMQPVKSVFSRMPRLVREIAGKLGKKVRLVMSGEQTEVDKTVIEELADPLMHMIRNSIDHGIENADVRLAAGKPEEGTVELTASQRGGSILITVSDDGAGIDRQKLRAKAVEKGIISADASLAGEEIDQLIFAPGFSTAEKVTDVSGRGVGMDVVRSNIANLGGRIQIQSTLGRGTKFTLVLPLTLAVLDGMLVAVSTETYILPLTNIVETIRPEKRAVRQLANGSTVVAIRGEFIKLVNLGDLFALPGAVQEPWKALVVVVELDSGGKLGIVVDELLGQRQVVVKSLQENFDPVPGISGATILGTGRVALILDIDQLSRLQSSSAARRLAFLDDIAGPPDASFLTDFAIEPGPHPAAA